MEKLTGKGKQNTGRKSSTEIWLLKSTIVRRVQMQNIGNAFKIKRPAI